MAVPTVIFSEEGRVKVARALGLTHWICIFPAVICLITALYIQLVVSDKILFIENYNGAVLPTFLVFTGFFSLFGHILCGKAFWENHKIEKREKWVKFLLPAIIVTILIFVFEMVAGIMCFVHVGELEESLDAGISTAMNVYKNDMTTKEEMDILQMEYECCGSRSYQDWFKVPWIHPDYLTRSQRHRKKHINDDVPFSCCTPHVLRPCINHHVHNNDVHYNYDYRVNTTLYNKGCTDKLMEFYEDTLLSNGGAIILGLSFVQLIVAVISRLFQTAVVASLSSDEEQGDSIGYLFGDVHVQENKESELDTTTETEASETADDQALLETSIESTEADIPLDADDTRYVPMDGLDHENTDGEVTYVNIGAGNQEDEHIYHDEEVERYLLDRYNTSRDHFENMPNEETPIVSKRNSVNADVYKAMSQNGMEAIYDEALPYPPDDVGIQRETEGRTSPSKHSVRKNSSAYVSYDYGSGAHLVDNIYENTAQRNASASNVNYPHLNTDNSSIVGKRMYTRFNLSDSSFVRKIRNNNIQYSPISRSQEYQMVRKQSRAVPKHNESDLTKYNVADKSRMNQSLPSRLNKGMLRRVFSRKSNSIAKDVPTSSAKFPQQRKAPTQTRPIYQHYGSVDKYQRLPDAYSSIPESSNANNDTYNDYRSCTKKKGENPNQMKDLRTTIRHEKKPNSASRHRVEQREHAPYSNDAQRKKLTGDYKKGDPKSYSFEHIYADTGAQKPFAYEEIRSSSNGRLYNTSSRNVYGYDIQREILRNESKPSMGNSYTPVKETFTKPPLLSQNKVLETSNSKGVIYSTILHDEPDHARIGTQALIVSSPTSEREDVDDAFVVSSDFKIERASRKSSDSIQLPATQRKHSLSPIYPIRSSAHKSPSKPDRVDNEDVVINLIPNPSS